MVKELWFTFKIDFFYLILKIDRNSYIKEISVIISYLIKHHTSTNLNRNHKTIINLIVSGLVRLRIRGSMFRKYNRYKPKPFSIIFILICTNILLINTIIQQATPASIWQQNSDMDFQSGTLININITGV